MQIGLCLIIKNEAALIHGCLEGVVDLFDDVVVIDTGSADGTTEILKRDFGITPLARRLSEEECFCKCAALNEGMSRLKTGWVFILDADERIEREELINVLALEDDPGLHGYFCAWNTYKNGEVIEDYKLCLFRKGIKKRGMIHDNAQVDFRRRGLKAEWLPLLSITHLPDGARDGFKARYYKDRLSCALAKEPDWHRYNWFLGYMYFRENRMEPAIEHLSIAACSESERFPVECLNARMVLADIFAAEGRERELAQTLAQALAYHDKVRDDFEVKINFRMRPWIEQAMEDRKKGRLDAIRAYRFSH